MQIIQLNSTYRAGGAAIAADRFKTAIETHTYITVKQLVQKKRPQNSSLPEDIQALLPNSISKVSYLFRHLISDKQLKPYGLHKSSLFSHFDKGVRHLSKHHWIQNADIIHLHWINDHFLSAKELALLKRSGKPVFWTLHDMWPFTGGCHYAGNCTRFQNTCGHCPILESQTQQDLSRHVWTLKEKTFSGLNLHIIGPSQWITRISQSSRLLGSFPHWNVPNAIRCDVFQPTPYQDGRPSRRLLFGGMNATGDPRKGFQYLLEALRLLAAYSPKPDYELFVFGSGADPEVEQQLPFPAKFTGHVQGDEALAQVYQKADLMIVPSLEDNLPNTILEALACGVPVVAFDVGGISDMVQTGVTGYLARSKDAYDLAEGIRYATQPERHRELSRRARALIRKQFDAPVIARRMEDIYRESLSQNRLSGELRQ